MTDVSFAIAQKLTPELRAELRDQLSLRAGERFDEALYNADLAGLADVLAEASYPGAKIDGRVIIDREQRTARIEYRIDAGPACVFGELRVQGAEGMPQALIAEAAAIPEGEPFRRSVVDDAQNAIFALDVFSSVRMDTRIEGRVVDVVAIVQPARVESWQAGVGVRSGSLRRVTSDETYSVPQWDVHLSASYTHKNFLGGLRHLRIEDRPALIFLDDFPGVPDGGPRIGNVLSVEFDQPAFIEARTKLRVNAAWDVGPDAFQGYFRHDLATKLILERTFLRQRLTARVAVGHDLYYVAQAEVPDDVSDYRLPYLEQQLVFDVRDDSARPRTGAYASAIVQEARRLGGYGSWNYVRLLPDVRGYVPLLWDVVLAARFALGILWVQEAASDLDPTSALLGPQTYRLRGGGAYSNRGFAAGRLGDGITGGSRRWEGSLELRVPLGGDLGAAVFGDVGDVHRETRFRFTHLNTALGFGLRYYSLLGALRFDAAWRVPGLQVVGGGDEPELEASVLPSAFHLTIGEAF